MRQLDHQAVVAGIVTLVLSLLAVKAVIAYAHRHAIFDIPTARSSHAAPVPRGGGLGVLLSVMLVAAFYVVRFRDASVLVPLGAACAVGVIGWLDDRRGISVRMRLLVHVGGGVAIAGFSLVMGGDLLWAAWWLFCAVSAINVVNFMDGIDGFVASQCFILCAALAFLAPPGSLGLVLVWIVGGALLGFLRWNWPPATIFLGDVGSGSLGLLTVFLGALVMRDADINLVRAFLPLFPMTLDAAWTMLRRVRNGERLIQAHRSHLYQRLANGGWTHQRVTLLFSAAAAAGAMVSVVRCDHWWTLASVYGLAVFAVGALLDRTRPFIWSSIDVPAR